MPYFSKEEIARAREMDLLTYLQNFEPGELVHVRGNTWSTREHDSLKISNGKWMWWSRGFGGASALDYLVKVRGDPFTDAMEKILGKAADEPSVFMYLDQTEPKKASQKKLLLPERAPDNDRVIRYLAGRGISLEVIKDCIREGLLYESLPYHNCVFVGYDDKGTARYASYRATVPEKIMGEAAGSDKRFSFRTNAKGRKLHVFECPIDLLSYLTLTKMQTGKWLSEPMISLGGVYEPNKDPSKWKLPVALQNMLQDHSEVTIIALHLDNDAAGKSAAWAIEGLLRDKYNVSYEPPPRGKDYNEYLMYITLGYKR